MKQFPGVLLNTQNRAKSCPMLIPSVVFINVVLFITPPYAALDRLARLTWTKTAEDPTLNQGSRHGRSIKQYLIRGRLAVPGSGHQNLFISLQQKLTLQRSFVSTYA